MSISSNSNSFIGRQIGRVQTVAGIALAGMQIWANPPAIHKFKLEGVEKSKDLIRINLKNQPSLWQKKLGKLLGSELSEHANYIAINIAGKEPHFDFLRGSAYLFDKHHKGSEHIGLAIFSLPVTIPLSPLLLGINIYYSLLETHVWGHSRHSHAVIKALDGQLDSDTDQVLRRAASNMWRHDQKFSDRPNLAASKKILLECRLVETLGTDIDGSTYSQYRWYDESGDCVAFFQYSGGDVWNMRVLGSQFYKPKHIYQLAMCYKSHEVL